MRWVCASYSRSFGLWTNSPRNLASYRPATMSYERPIASQPHPDTARRSGATVSIIPGKGESSRIEHVVVLMLENRSFDHLLGFLQHPNANEFDGVPPGSHNVDASGTAIPATADGVPHGLDPDHSHEAALVQLSGVGNVPDNGGFVKSYETRVDTFKGRHDHWVASAAGRDVMRCLDPAQHSPVLSTLAAEFAVCDAW